MTSHTPTVEIQSIPLNLLKKSPRNVRQMPHAGLQIEALADSIQAHGLIQNLVVETEREEGDKATGFYLVTAGEGRRLAQLLRVKRQQIPSDEPIRCLIEDGRDAVALSLAENEIRQRMHPADQFDAFKRLVDAGQSIEDVAAQFGVTPLAVQRRLKLANVCPDLIAVYREGHASLEQLMALAITDDHERQKAVWENAKGYELNPDQLRAALTETEVDARNPVARFVGLKAYVKAGGNVRRDLFADEQDQGYFTDPDLLNRLALERLERQAKKLKADGVAWVHVALHMPYEERAAFSRVQQVEREPTAEEQAKLDAWEVRIQQIEAAADSVDDEDTLANDLSDEADALQEEIDELRESFRVPSPEQQALAGAWVSIDSNGKLQVERDILKAEDAKRFSKARKGLDGKGKPKGERTHSAALVRYLTAHQTMALQATLIEKPEVAFVALVHRLAVQTFFNQGHWSGTVQIEAKKASPEMYFVSSDTPKARDRLTEQGEKWRSQLPGDADLLFAWLLEQSHKRLLTLCAYCTAITVNGVTDNEGGNRLDAMIEAVGLDMTRWWQPTAEGYLSRIPKARILDAVREATSPEIAATLTNLKRGECAKAAEKRLNGTGWLPSSLRGRAG